MRNQISHRIHRFLIYKELNKIRFYSHHCYKHNHPIQTPKTPGISCISYTFKASSIDPKPTSNFHSFTALRYINATSYTSDETREDPVVSSDDSNGEVEPIDSWEEEDEAESEVGDGGNGGGVIFQNCPWGERALSIAREVLGSFGEDMKLYAFKTSPRGYIYVRLDKLSNEYGCPSMEEIESFSRLYKKSLDEVGAKKEIPEDLALEVSSPGVDRLLKVPDDLLRFKDMPMVVSYSEDTDNKCMEKIGVYFLDSIDIESRCCVWKLADVKENRDPSAKGRPFTRKQKDWRIKLSNDSIKRVTFYLSY